MVEKRGINGGDTVITAAEARMISNLNKGCVVRSIIDYFDDLITRSAKNGNPECRLKFVKETIMRIAIQAHAEEIVDVLKSNGYKVEFDRREDRLEIRIIWDEG